ncbi:hypothetical protein P154DRAFT_520703 [Amniculicola lignicola CBS 123094]|uniref:RING-type domain-containing protein n=1 Tax=Amniculicola lignicola CBS 123094 TaxID=1392246 RepID=A0A6A5WQA0_9PLEO|nr:hypothetical protein P154DRAFT_520703 [Amniculicola lignicola CBS 123094]
MEYIVRCNDLKCRAQLQDRAVVTTCSHVFCIACSDRTGLAQASNANRQCPACGTVLGAPDDVVVAGLNPSEDYKTSVLSGLSPSIILECASRGLGFYSYQASQEIVYQEHLAKSLTEKYAGLNQQMDQLIHDANAQIKMLQDKLHSKGADVASLEQKLLDLNDAFREKSRALQHVQKLYQSLKAQVMASHVATAAGDEADFTLQTARGDRFVDRIPGTRSGTANFSQMGVGIQGGGRQHRRDDSGSSGNGGGASGQRGGVALGSGWNQQHESAPVGTPSQSHRSRLPVLGGTRPSNNSLLGVNAGPAYQPSPVTTRQPLGVGRNMGAFGFKRPGGANNTANGPLRR